MPAPTTFDTARLRAERLRAEHRPELRRMKQDPEQMRLLGGVVSDAGVEAYTAKAFAHWEAHGFGLWMLHDRTSGACIGRALLRRTEIEGVPEVEVGYGLDAPWWGKGLAVEIATELLRIARHELALRTVVAVTTPANTASQRVLEKCGLTLDRQYGEPEAPKLLFRVRWDDVVRDEIALSSTA